MENVLVGRPARSSYSVPRTCQRLRRSTIPGPSPLDGARPKGQVPALTVLGVPSDTTRALPRATARERALLVVGDRPGSDPAEGDVRGVDLLPLDHVPGVRRGDHHVSARVDPHVRDDPAGEEEDQVTRACAAPADPGGRAVLLRCGPRKVLAQEAVDVHGEARAV